jgi:C1A family cysteine protease
MRITFTQSLSRIDSIKSVVQQMKAGKYQWVRDLPDSRDHIYQLAPLTLAPSVDLRQYCSAIEDQGQLGSCTGNAIAGMIELIDKKNNKNLDVSRLFIYYQERVIEGTVRYDSGAYIRDGLKAVNQYGAPLESLWPYTINKFATKPTTQAYSDALNRKATAYAKCTNLAAIKNALSAGQPVTIGFSVYGSFEGAWGNIPHGQAGSGMMPMPNKRTEQLLGGHAVAVVGYNDTLNGGRLICRNSWGTSWGDNGYFYMPYGVINDTSMSSDFWTISAVHNP